MKTPINADWAKATLRAISALDDAPLAASPPVPETTPTAEELAVITDVGAIFLLMGKHGISRVEEIDGGGYAVYAKKDGISAPLREIVDKHRDFIVEAGKQAKRARN